MKMNPLTSLLRVNWSSGRMRLFDLGIAIATLLYGLVVWNTLVIWIGMAAIILSLINPMGRIQKGLSGFVKPARRG